MTFWSRGGRLLCSYTETGALLFPHRHFKSFLNLWKLGSQALVAYLHLEKALRNTFLLCTLIYPVHALYRAI